MSCSAIIICVCYVVICVCKVFIINNMNVLIYFTASTYDMDGEVERDEEGEEEMSASSESPATSDDDSDDSDASTVGYSDDDDEWEIDTSNYDIATTPVTFIPNLPLPNHRNPGEPNVYPDLTWTRVDAAPDKVDDFAEPVGINHIYGVQEPIGFFNLVWAQRLWDLLVNKSNTYGTDKGLKGWKNVNTRIMKGWFAIVLNMGLTRKNRINDYWSIRFSQSTPWFRNAMARDRWKSILRAVHVVDNRDIPAKEHPDYRPSLRIRPLIEYFNSVSKHYFRANKELSIDESLVAGKVRNPIRQYMPNKHHNRWGTKLWLLADSPTGYILQLYVYEGAQYDPTSGHGTGYDVVVRLMQMGNVLDKSHHLYLDNLFVSYAVGKFLLDHKTFMTGTMRRNLLKYLPTEVNKVKPSVGESIYFEDNNKQFLAMAYKQKKTQSKHLIMLSTFWGASNVPHRKKQDATNPKVVDNYNQNMGGVDSSDQVLYTYLLERKSRSWSRKVMFNIFGRLVMNAYILYAKTVAKPVDRLQFILSLIDSLLAEYRDGEEAPGSSGKKKGLEKLPGKKEKQCCVCSGVGGVRKRSRTVCSVCQKGLHGLCSAKHVCK